MTKEFIKQCSVCKKIKINDKWINPTEEDINKKEISHGLCFDCFKIEMTGITDCKKFCDECEIKDACFNYRKDDVCLLEERELLKC